MKLKKNGDIFTSKFVGTGPSSYKKKNLPGCCLTKVEKHCSRVSRFGVNGDIRPLLEILDNNSLISSLN